MAHWYVDVVPAVMHIHMKYINCNLQQGRHSFTTRLGAAQCCPRYSLSRDDVIIELEKLILRVGFASFDMKELPTCRAWHCQTPAGRPHTSCIFCSPVAQHAIKHSKLIYFLQWFTCHHQMLAPSGTQGHCRRLPPATAL
jgi:hypothetical protein